MKLQEPAEGRWPLDEFVPRLAGETLDALARVAGFRLRSTDPSKLFAEEAEESPFHITLAVVFRGPRLALRLVSGSPPPWSELVARVREQSAELASRAQSFERLSDRELVAVAEDAVSLFQRWVRDAVFTTATGAVRVYWTVMRLSSRHRKFADRLPHYLLDLLFTKQDWVHASATGFLELLDQADRSGLARDIGDALAEAGALPEDGPGAAETYRARLGATRQGTALLQLGDEFAASLPIDVSRIDWSFSPRPEPPIDLVIGSVLDDLLQDSKAMELLRLRRNRPDAAKALPLHKRARWRRADARLRAARDSLAEVARLLLELVPLFQGAVDEMARRLAARRQVTAAKDVMWLRYPELLKAVTSGRSQRRRVAARRRERLRNQARRGHAAEPRPPRGDATPKGATG